VVFELDGCLAATADYGIPETDLLDRNRVLEAALRTFEPKDLLINV